MLFLYNISIHCLILGIKIAALFNFKAKQAIQGRKNWRKKIKEALKDIQQPIVWIHVSSLGEFEQARPLITHLKLHYPKYKILITFFSPSGYNAQKNFEYADFVFYLPYDTIKNAKDFLDIVNPKFIFFIKYEFWINYLNTIIKRKKYEDLKCFLISSIFRKYQAFFHWYGSIFKHALNAFDGLFVQDKLSIKLLKKIRIDKYVHLAGDTRIDRVIEIAQQNTDITEIKKFCTNHKVIICGSTWHQDEKILIPALKQLKQNYELKIIIAPHQPDKANIQRLIKLLNENNFSYCRYTKLSNTNDNSTDVMIIDTIGILNKIYKYGLIAYIGGGFTDGIHNILEPAVYGLPVIFGKKYHKFYEATELIKLKAAFSVTNEKELFSAIHLLLNNENTLNSAKKSVLEFINEHKGAVNHTMNVLKNYLNND